MTIDEQDLRKYLLGSLSPEREAELRELFERHADLREELLAREAELFDEYVEGCLAGDEKDDFETFVLTTDGGQEKLRFAQNFSRFKSIDNSEEVSTVHCAPAPRLPPTRSSSALFAPFNRNPAFAVLLIILATLLLTLIAYVSLMKPRANPVIKSAAAEPVFHLAPGSVNVDGGLPKLAAPATNQRVRLELELAKSDFKEYKTQLFRENQALDSQDELKTEPRSSHYVVPVTVTGNILTPGDYHLKLSGVPLSGQPEYIDSYSFRITNEDRQREQLTR